MVDMIEERRIVSRFDASVPGILALAMTILVAVMVLLVLTRPTPPENETLVTQVVTGVLGAWVLMLGFYYGTTHTQGRKDATIQTLANTAQAAGAALAPVVPGEINLPVGQSATVRSTETGATIDKETKP